MATTLVLALSLTTLADDGWMGTGRVPTSIPGSPAVVATTGETPQGVVEQPKDVELVAQAYGVAVIILESLLFLS